MRKLGLVSLLLLLSTLAISQKPQQWNAADIEFHLEKLGVLGRVLYLAAHPDDENTSLIAYLSKGKMYETAYLSLTRGDGGQNLIGSEQASELGLIRTEELLGARSVDGAQQFFSTANDFGFSKNATETLKFWGHDSILANVVWVIRKYQPDIIINRFPPDARAGHGHHWSSAILSHEAFKAAADPNQFKEQLAYVKPWQVKRVLWNTHNFGGLNTTSPNQFHVEIGGFNPRLGQSYGQIAAESRSMHKSQGFGVAPVLGSKTEYFQVVDGDNPHKELLDGVQTSWDRIEGGAAIGEAVNAIIHDFQVADPAASVPGLLSVYKKISALPEGRWKQVKLQETKDLIVACLGLFADATTSKGYWAQGSHEQIDFRALNRSTLPVTLESYTLNGASTKVGKALVDGELYSTRIPVEIATTAEISEPYWLKNDHPLGTYKVDDKQLVGRPMNPPAYQVTVLLNIQGTQLPLSLPVQYRYTDEVKGERYEPLVIAPAVAVNLTDPVVIMSPNQPEKRIHVEVKGFKDQIKGTLHIELPAALQVVDNDLPFALAKAGDSWNGVFKVRLASTLKQSVSLDAAVTAKVEGRTYDRSIRVIEHDHIPVITHFPKASVRVAGLDIKTTGKNIGYIEGAGDLVPQALKQLGYQVTPIQAAGVSLEELARFDAIITGIRAYNINPLLRALQPKLLEYVKQGGVLVVQYNKNGQMVTDPLGPYPFSVSGDRVTEEDAEVKWLLPDHPAMQYPNKLIKADFDHWIQERGLYFTRDADPHYSRLFEMHDKGSAALDGSTLVASYGKGKYVYSALDFFRELPAGIPGAFRLFVNLLAKPTSDKK